MFLCSIMKLCSNHLLCSKYFKALKKLGQTIYPCYYIVAKERKNGEIVCPNLFRREKKMGNILL